ncbi:MAG: tetratricopeptide repeat protein [Calditrichia bacterium]|jgi:tetratricopeptide (TPR) repeat protein|nr:tetratricopeptide repeat protein [Calditrichia bacterium]
MICINCKQTLPENAKYCSQCGHKIFPTDNISEKNKDNSASFLKPAHAYVLILSVVAIAILIVVLILDSNKGKIEKDGNISTNTSELSEETKVQLEKLTKDPESIQLNIEIGNLLFDSGKFDEAILYYQKSLVKDSLNIALQIDLAVCYFNLRKIDRAIVEMKKALIIDPNHPKGLFNIGVIYYTLGEFETAREYWGQLISDDPEGMEAKRAQELLDNLQ